MLCRGQGRCRLSQLADDRGAQAQDNLSLKLVQMVSSQDKAASQIAGLDEAADALASNEFVMGTPADLPPVPPTLPHRRPAAQSP
jgi:hypothetical protein